MEQARLLSTLGDIHMAAGNADAAVDSHRQSLAIRTTAPSANPYDVGFGHYHLANALRVGEWHGEAAREFDAARAIWEQPDVLGPDHEHVGECVFRLAEALRLAGRLDEAGSLYERAIRIEETNFGPDHEYVAERLDEARGVEARAAAIRAVGQP